MLHEFKNNNYEFLVDTACVFHIYIHNYFSVPSETVPSQCVPPQLVPGIGIFTEILKKSK